MKRPAQQSEQNMKTKVRVKKQPVEAKTQPLDIQRRIKAGWLRLWKAVYPNTPPPGEGQREVQSLKSKVQSPGSRVEDPKSKVQRLQSKVSSLRSKVPSPEDRRPAAVERLASFLSVWLALGLLATGCAGARPLRGGKAVTTRKPAGVIEQTLVQGENASQATKQDQESVKVRSYTVPAGSRIEQSPTPGATAAQTGSPTSASRQPLAINSQPSSKPLGIRPRFLARAIWPALPATRAVASTYTQRRKALTPEDTRHPPDRETRSDCDVAWL